MNPREYMIIDLERRGDKSMFITEQVASISSHHHRGWSVRFISSPAVFTYNKARLLYLTSPELIDLEEKGLYIRNKRIANLRELLRFSFQNQHFYRVSYTNGETECLDGRDVYITRTRIDIGGGSTWSYLCKLAEETGLCTEHGYNVLSNGYNQVDLKRDNVPLAQYLGHRPKLATYLPPRQIYFPFGCNASQKTAVESALTHQVSIIQGPPGTGKTQTILNIIANLLLADKTILIVSNNNSAVANVAEKLQREGLGFIVAQLGNSSNKEAFIAQQPIHSPDISSWASINVAQLMERSRASLRAVSQGFEAQTEQAQLQAEYDVLRREQGHNDLLKSQSVQIPICLSGKSSETLIKLLTHCRLMCEYGKQPSLWFRLKWSYLIDWHLFTFLQGDLRDITPMLEQAYYQARQSELEQALSTIADKLQAIDLKGSIEELTQTSLQILKCKIARRYTATTRPQFTLGDLKNRSEAFLREYPVVLSSSYKCNDNISPDYVFDYVIMDEASQIDLKTGALALSCATNAVIVGDDKQLPNVVGKEEAQAIRAIHASYKVAECYNALKLSFLQSCTEVLGQAPITLLREHYRCHPKIIGFCNQQFYDGELIAMTRDRGEDKVLQVVRTVKGNHARGHLNQREIDVILQEVLPEYIGQGSLGIITPYKEQAEAINRALGQDIASTVHKYQGQECDTIIISMVDNMPTDFSDDASLLNVAISRAKKHLCIVATGNDIPEERILSQLINYIQYHNFEVKESKLHSVFDLLYRQYTSERLSYQAKHQQVSDYLSESLVYDCLCDALQEMGRNHLSIACHYPLSRLIADYSPLDAEEIAFVESPLAHVDFLIYNTLTKRPLLTIEVDGWSYHRGRIVQESRDELKDKLLGKYYLSPLRISTTATLTTTTLQAMLTHHLPPRNR